MQYTQTAMGFWHSSVSGQCLHGLDALGADILAMEGYDVLCTIAEDTGGLILLHNNVGAIDVDLETIAFGDVQRTAKFNREDNPSQLVYFAYDTGRFHFFHPFPVKTVDKIFGHL